MVQSKFVPQGNIGIVNTLLTATPVRDGEAVNAEVTNRLPSVNSANTAYLNEKLRSGFSNNALYVWDAPVSPDAIVGDIVYYEPYEGTFNPGLARFQTVAGVVTTAESANIWGMVTAIRDNKCDVCLRGLCTITLPIESQYTVDTPPGLRFLSNIVYGNTTDVPITPRICVGQLIGVHTDGTAQFNIDRGISPNTNEHDHVVYEITVNPAGNWTPGDTTISGANSNIIGWLPASHSVFGGKAPTGAVYGYNGQLFKSNNWPPTYIDKITLSWQRCEDTSDDPLRSEVADSLFFIDDTTIWWMTSDTRYTPWNANDTYVAGVRTNVPTQAYDQRMWMNIIYSLYGTSNQVVTSLRTTANSGLSVKAYPSDAAANTGDLILDLKLDLTVSDTIDYSPNVVKSITDENKLSVGPAVTGIKLDSSMTSISSYEEIDIDGYMYGRLVLSDATGTIGSEVPFQAVFLSNVREIMDRGVLGLAYPNTYSSYTINRVSVPVRGGNSSYQLSVLLGILLPILGTAASDEFQLSYLKIAAPKSGNDIALNTTVNAFTQSDFINLNLNAAASNTFSAGGYYMAESDAISVSAGDEIMFKLARKNPTAYANDILVVRTSGLLKM